MLKNGNWDVNHEIQRIECVDKKWRCGRDGKIDGRKETCFCFSKSILSLALTMFNPLYILFWIWCILSVLMFISEGEDCLSLSFHNTVPYTAQPLTGDVYFFNLWSWNLEWAPLRAPCCVLTHREWGGKTVWHSRLRHGIPHQSTRQSRSCSTSNLTANIPRKEEDGSSALASSTNMGDHDGVPGFWLQHGPALVIVSTWGVKQYMEDLSLCHPVFQTNELNLF